MHKTGGPITRKVLGVRGRATSRFVQNDLAGVLGYVATSENGPINFKHKEKFLKNYVRKTAITRLRKGLLSSTRAQNVCYNKCYQLVSGLGYRCQSFLNFKHKEIFLNLQNAITRLRKGLLSSTKAQNVCFNKCYQLVSVLDYRYESLFNFKHKEIFLNLKISITRLRKGVLISTKAQNVRFNKCYQLMSDLEYWYQSLLNFKHKEIFLNLKIAVTQLRKGVLSSIKAQNVCLNKCY